MNAIASNVSDQKIFLPLKKAEGAQALKPKRDVGSLKGKKDDAAALRKAAEDFEAVFMAQILKQMRNTVHKEEMFHGGMGEDIFTEMLDEKFAQKMAGRGSVGIADLLYQQLSRQFGIAEDDTPALPNPTGSADALQQKLREVETQIRARGPFPQNIDL